MCRQKRLAEVVHDQVLREVCDWDSAAIVCREDERFAQGMRIRL